MTILCLFWIGYIHSGHDRYTNKLIDCLESEEYSLNFLLQFEFDEDCFLFLDFTTGSRTIVECMVDWIIFVIFLF